MSPRHLARHLEEHADEIADQLVRAVRQHAELASHRRLAEPELRALFLRLVQLLAEARERAPELAHSHELEALGRQRWREGIPLAEVLLVMKLGAEHSLAALQAGELEEDQPDELRDERSFARELEHLFEAGVRAVERGYAAERFGKIAPPDALPARRASALAPWLTAAIRRLGLR
jgi:hypothetical protein